MKKKSLHLFCSSCICNYTLPTLFDLNWEYRSINKHPLSLIDRPNDSWWRVHIAEIFIRQFSSLSLSDPNIRLSVLI